MAAAGVLLCGIAHAARTYQVNVRFIGFRQHRTGREIRIGADERLLVAKEEVRDAQQRHALVAADR
jgi:hypothetical protein